MRWAIPEKLEKLPSDILREGWCQNAFAISADGRSVSIESSDAIAWDLRGAGFLVMRDEVWMSLLYDEFSEDVYTWNDEPDIIRYAYLYIPSFRHLIELQIGEEFAMYTFKVYSMIRYFRDEHGTNINVPFLDLWTDNFYTKCKDHILKKSKNQSSDFNAHLEIKRIYEKELNINKDIKFPEDLEKVLKTLD